MFGSQPRGHAMIIVCQHKLRHPVQHARIIEHFVLQSETRLGCDVTVQEAPFSLSTPLNKYFVGNSTYPCNPKYIFLAINATVLKPHEG